MAQALGTSPRNAPIGQRRDRASVRRDELIEELIDLFILDGFIGLSIEDVARELKRSKSTLYSVADSKEQMVVAVVRGFFRRATARVDQRLQDAEQQSPHRRHSRIIAYFEALSGELASASPQFFADLLSLTPTRDAYRAAMEATAERVRDLVLEAVPQASAADATFLGTVAVQTMEAMHRGDIEQATGLTRPAVYIALGDLVQAGATASAKRNKVRLATQ